MRFHQVTAAITIIASFASPSLASQRRRVAATPIAARPAQATPASTAPAVCSELQIAIEASEKRLSGLNAEGIADNSAPRQAMRNTESTSILQKITANIEQMKASGCSPYPHVISDAAYLHPAMQCHIADIKAQTAAVNGMGAEEALKTMTEACDQSKWVRNPGS